MSSGYLRALAARVLAPRAVLQPRPAAVFEERGVSAVEPIDVAAELPRVAEQRAPAIAAPWMRARIAEAKPMMMTATALPQRPREREEHREVVIEREPAAVAEMEVVESGPAADVDVVERPVIAPSGAPRIRRGHPLPASEKRDHEDIAPAPVPAVSRRLPVVRRMRAAAAPPILEERAAPIEISIGRIDVRAVVDGPPAQAKPSRAKAPMMSLDEYLARRSGRGE